MMVGPAAAAAAVVPLPSVYIKASERDDTESVVPVRLPR